MKVAPEHLRTIAWKLQERLQGRESAATTSATVERSPESGQYRRKMKNAENTIWRSTAATSAHLEQAHRYVLEQDGGRLAED